MSIRRACAAFLFDMSTFHYEPRRPGQAHLEQKIREICEPRVRYGHSKAIRVGQGSEFVSRNLDLWADATDITLDFSWSGKPIDNAFIEAFNGRFRAECLNANLLLTPADAREKMEAWLRYHNENRRCGLIVYKPLIALANPGSRTGQLP